MPDRRSPNKSPGKKLCGQDRPAYDIAGRFNDLLNCYLESFGEAVSTYLPQIVLGIILLIVMVFALRELIKD